MISFKIGFMTFVVSFFVLDTLAATTIAPPLASTSTSLITVPKSRYERGLEDYDEANKRQSRGMMMDDHEDHAMMESKAVASDPWSHYSDFFINEGSFKFWSVFQLVTALLLIYSAFAAIYYAKFNVITPDYDDYDYSWKRSFNDAPSTKPWSGLSAQTFQRIFDALSSKKYS